MTWLIIGVLIWVALAIPAAVLIGRGIRLADARRNAPVSDVLEADFVPSEDAAAETLEEPETGPETVPPPQTRLPRNGDRGTSPRPRPTVVRRPIQPGEREPRARDSGLS
jgi:hypothetical protein